MKQTIVIGNIITMDEKRPCAKAALVKDGVFVYIGDVETAKSLASPDAKVLDYGEKFIYPGFLESHCHGYFAGYRAIGQADLTQVMPPDYDKYRKVMEDFIEKNPDREVYLAAGWAPTGDLPTKAYLDDICPDKPLIMHEAGGHSMLLNSKALERFGIDSERAKEFGYDLVHVDENGEPNGNICELPVLEIIQKIPNSIEDAKRYLLYWQDFIVSKGFTGVADAGAELFFADASKAYHELEQEGKLKLRTYSYLLVPDNVDAKTEMPRIIADRVKYSGEYYHIIGIKAFLDGVTEAHTGWQNQDYADEPGYHGLERFNDHDKMVELLVAADREGLSVHVHSEGGGATHFMLGCIEDAEKITGDMDQRNVIAHLHFVTDEDIRRMAETRSIPAVAPLWTARIPGAYDREVGFVGRELAEQAYPINSFIDAGAVPVFHSDYPVSSYVDVGASIFMAEARAIPLEEFGGMESTQGNLNESIDREQSLKAMTINVARAWHQEDRVGSIEIGKIANMAVFDCDFLHDDLEKVISAKTFATIIDGEEVYKA